MLGAADLGRPGFGECRARHRARDLVLDREHLGDVAIERFAPEYLSRLGLDELGRDSEPLLVALHASLDQIGDAQLATDRPGVGPRLAVRVGRDERDHGNHVVPANAHGREPRREISRQALGQELLVQVAAQHGKRQHRDRSVRPRGPRAGEPVPRVSGRFGDEAEPDPFARADHPLGVAVVSDRVPGLGQGRRERGIPHHDIGPDRIDQLDLGHRAIAVLGQVQQHPERGGLELHGLAAPAQLVAPEVQLVLTE